MPNSTQARITRRRFSVPARCPASRGNPRARAQRPLPSMMMATCSGIFSGSSFEADFAAAEAPALDLKDLGLLPAGDLIHLLDDPIGELLQLGLPSVKLVLGNQLLFLILAQVVQDIAADIAHRHPGFFGPAPQDFHQILAPFFGEG